MFSLLQPSELPACALRSSLLNYTAKLIIFPELCKQNNSLNLLLSSCFKLYKVMPNYLRLYLAISENFCTFAVQNKFNS